MIPRQDYDRRVRQSSSDEGVFGIPTPVPTPTPTSTPTPTNNNGTTGNADTSNINNAQLGTSDAEKKQQEDDRARQQAHAEAESTKTDSNKSGGGDADSGGFPIPAIFKIVPIGLNVIAKAPNLATGFVDIIEGVEMALVNTVLSSFDLFVSTLDFSVQGFKFLMIVIICLVENLSNFNTCILFYICDLIVLIVYLVIFSILALIDNMFLIKYAGISSAEMVGELYSPIMQLDDTIYGMTGMHVVGYPDYIIQRCYTCKYKLNVKETTKAENRFMNVVFDVIPGRLLEPIYKFYDAGVQFSSIFDI